MDYVKSVTGTGDGAERTEGADQTGAASTSQTVSDALNKVGEQARSTVQAVTGIGANTTDSTFEAFTLLSHLAAIGVLHPYMIAREAPRRSRG